MKKYLVFPVLAVLGGAGAFLLRLMQLHTGFEAATGLPVPGNLWARLLVGLLAVLAALILLCSRRLPEEAASPAAFADAFRTDRAGLLAVPVTGVFLLGLSGALDVLGAFGFRPGGGLAAGIVGAGARFGSSPSPRTLVLQGLVSLVTAACLFSAAAVCRRSAARPAAPRRAFRSTLLLVPVICLVVRLVLDYRANSIDPSLSAYYVELLALVFLTLGLYRLSSFGYQAGRTRRLALYALPAAVLCIAALADSGSLADLLLYAGGALTLLGFLLLRLEVLATPWDNP